MTGSRRTTILPRDWKRIRARVLWRDRKICQIQGPTCAYTASEVDHIGRSDNHDLANLQSVCRPCHAVKTKNQAAIGRRNQAQARVAAKFRTPEAHPGMLRHADEAEDESPPPHYRRPAAHPGLLRPPVE